LKVLVWKWDSIGMDYVIHRLRSMKGHDVIWVIVDQLTKNDTRLFYS